MKVILAAFFAIPGALLAFGIFYVIGMWWLFPPIFAACLFYTWRQRQLAPPSRIVTCCDCGRWWSWADSYEDGQEKLRLHVAEHRVVEEPLVADDQKKVGSDDGLGRFGGITDLDGH